MARFEKLQTGVAKLRTILTVHITKIVFGRRTQVAGEGVAQGSFLCRADIVKCLVVH